MATGHNILIKGGFILKETSLGLKKAELKDNADLTIFISENMEKIDNYLDQALHTYIYEQETAKDEWVIEHGLKKKPSVVVVDSAGTVVFGKVIYESKNKLKILFSAKFAGKAYLN